MAAEENPTGFEINGEVYEIPRLDTFDMDEAQILYDLAKVTIEDFAPLHPDSPQEEKDLHEAGQMLRIRNPAFKRALIHIAYRRRNLDVSRDEIEALVGKVNALDSSIALLRGDDEDPPAMSSPSEPESKSSGNETSPSTDSGRPSGSDLDERAVILGPIGTGKSDTSSTTPAMTSAS